MPSGPGGVAVWYGPQRRQIEGRVCVGPTLSGRSGPELTLEPILGLVDGALVGPGGKVLPAAIGHHERDVGALAGLDRLRRLRERGVQDRAGRDSGEDALELEQLPDPTYGVTRAHREASVDQVGVVELGDEALVEVAQAVDELAVPRLGGDDPHPWLRGAEEAADAHQGAGGAEPRDEVGDARKVG